MYKNGEESLGIFNIPAFWHHIYLYIYKAYKNGDEFGYLLRPFRHTKNEMRTYSPITYFGFVYILLRSVVVSCCLCRLMFHDAVWCLLTFFVVFGFFDVICRFIWGFVILFVVFWLLWCFLMPHDVSLRLINVYYISWCFMMLFNVCDVSIRVKHCLPFPDALFSSEFWIV